MELVLYTGIYMHRQCHAPAYLSIYFCTCYWWRVRAYQAGESVMRRNVMLLLLSILAYSLNKYVCDVQAAVAVGVEWPADPDTYASRRVEWRQIQYTHINAPAWPGRAWFPVAESAALIHCWSSYGRDEWSDGTAADAAPVFRHESPTAGSVTDIAHPWPASRVSSGADRRRSSPAESSSTTAGPYNK